ncbi:MAG: caspase family protein [Myxococcales bacterium]
MIRFLCAWAAAYYLSFAVAARAEDANTWLVSIGNNQGDRSETTLLYAERDAKEIAEVLRMFGGVSGRRSTMLLGEQVDTVRRTLLETNTEIRNHSSKERPSTLIVFYSGHADADALHMDSTRLPFEELRNLVAGSPASVRILVVDSCRSGEVTRVKGVKPAPSFQISVEGQGSAEGSVIITSSAAGESSQESDALQGSFFSHHLVNALRGAADRDGDRQVTLNETYAYAYAQTLASTGRTVALQHPTYEYDVKGRAPIVLSRLDLQAAHAGTVRLAESATYLITAARGGHVLAELSPDKAGTRIALPAGAYTIQQRFPDEYREYRVEVASGSELDLGQSAYEAIRYDRLVRKGGSEHVSRPPTQGLLALGGVHGELIDAGLAPQLVLGYGLDFSWLSMSLRARLGRTTLHYDDHQREGHHDELMAGLTFARVKDLRWASVGLGVLFEGGVHRQTVGAPQPVRLAYGVNLGAFAMLECPLFAGAALHLEAGPMTALFQRSQVQDGAAHASELASILTWWAAGGLVWRL